MVGTCSTSTLTPSQEEYTHKGGHGLYCIILSPWGVAINVLSPEGASKLRIPQDNSTKITYKDKHTMWKTPTFKEVAVGLEINCYACAEI